MAHALALGPLLAESDLRALLVATNPHLTKNMKELYNHLNAQANWSSIGQPAKTSEQTFYEAVAFIQNARGHE